LEPVGHTRIVNFGDIIYFCNTNNNVCPVSDRHSITLVSLDPDNNQATINVVILVSSTPTKYTLYLNKPIEIDVDGDGIPDIRITLLGLSDSNARFNFVNLTAAGTSHLLGMLGVGG
jgi:hypothetical protein